MSDFKFKLHKSEISLEEVRFEKENEFPLLTQTKDAESYWVASVMDGSTMSGGPKVSLSRSGPTAQLAFEDLATALREQNIEVI